LKILFESVIVCESWDILTWKYLTKDLEGIDKVCLYQNWTSISPIKNISKCQKSGFTGLTTSFEPEKSKQLTVKILKMKLTMNTSCCTEQTLNKTISEIFTVFWNLIFPHLSCSNLFIDHIFWYFNNVLNFLITNTWFMISFNFEYLVVTTVLQIFLCNLSF
jgi:hypothetical protein